MELDRTVGKREENSILRESGEELASFAFSPYMLWEWGYPGDIPLRSKGAAFAPSPFWTCLSLLLRECLQRRSPMRHWRRPLVRQQPRKLWGAGRLGLTWTWWQRLVASWNSAAPRLQLEVPTPWRGLGLPITACHHCVSRTPFPPLMTTISESFHLRARARWLVCANKTYSEWKMTQGARCPVRGMRRNCVNVRSIRAIDF